MGPDWVGLYAIADIAKYSYLQQNLHLRFACGIVPVMNRKLINSICKELPGAIVSDPWGGGHDAWKVGGKMFACIGSATNGVSVKTDSIETAEMLIDAGVGIKAPYFHRSWILLPFETPDDELRHRIRQSYQIVRASLTKKEQSKLDPLD